APAPPAISTLSLHDALPILRLLDGHRHLAGDGGEEVELLVREKRRREADDLEHAQDLSARPHGHGQLAEAFALPALKRRGATQRSEEHTSELQSRVDLVCRL